MEVEISSLSGVVLLTPKRFGDDRGYFSETWNRAALVDAGINDDFVQDNESSSANRFTFRGFHFQRPPNAQAKLVRVLRGAVLDVVIDVRKGSPSFGQHLSVELSSANGRQIYIPVGFAHGFLTLHPETVVLYKASNYYAPADENGIRYDDPHLGISWPATMDQLTINERDQGWPGLAEIEPLA